MRIKSVNFEIYTISPAIVMNDIISELRQLRTAIATLIGTADYPEKEKFSKAALEQAKKNYIKWSGEKGAWVKEDDIGKYIKNPGWRAGRFIREQFGFWNVIKDGHYYLYNKADLIALNKELEKRKINLKRYIDLLEDQEKFKKSLTAKKKNQKSRPYQLPDDLENVTTSDVPHPPVEVIQQDINRLIEEFQNFKMAEYVDVYKNSHAMLKSMYYFEKYLDPEIRKRCKRWIDDFNYANHALELVKGKKVKFSPLKDGDMIQL